MKLLLTSLVLLFGSLDGTLGQTPDMEPTTTWSCLGHTDTKCSGADGVFNETNCSTQFGNLTVLKFDTESLIAHQIQASLQYLLMASHFNEWRVNRKGFHKYFNERADDAWNDAVENLQHFVRRGGALSKAFKVMVPLYGNDRPDYKIDEIRSMAVALDIEKSIGDRMESMLHTSHVSRDYEFSHFLAENLANKNAHRIKHVANHVHSLVKATNGADPSLMLYIYDKDILQ